MAGRIAYYGGIVRDGLVLNLDAAKPDSYPRTGTTWRDISGNQRNGTLINGPTFNPDNGGSIVFDGVDDNVLFGDVLDLGTNNITVNQWVNLSSIGTSQTFLSKARAAPQNYRYSTGLAGPSNNRLASFMQGNGGSDIQPYGSTTLSTNTWFMATYVFTRSSSISIYYNGIQESLTGNATISQWNNLDFQSNNPFRIGSYTASNNTTPISLTNGRIGITQVYFRALTAQEVLQNYNATKGRFGL
jgi:hypothetical protein